MSLFVCSVPGDTGVRPGAIPSNFWATSLIFLVEQNTGATIFPSTLTAGSEYNLVAVIGNRGNSDGGNYLTTPGPGIETSGIVMVWNTVDSPGVELPSLSNLDVTDKNPIYEQYFLKSGQYDVVGFRLNVQTVYDGIIAAVNQAISGGTLNTGALPPTSGCTGNQRIFVRRLSSASKAARSPISATPRSPIRLWHRKTWRRLTSTSRTTIWYLTSTGRISSSASLSS